MATDRRLGPRKHGTLEVMVRDKKRGLQSCLTRDIRLDGAYVETHALALRKNTKVDLILLIPSSGKTEHHHVEAKVANSETHGATLIFRRLDEPAYSALVDLLYPAE